MFPSPGFARGDGHGYAEAVASDPLSYRRRLLAVELLATLFEVAVVGLPLLALAPLDEAQRLQAATVAPPVVLTAWLAFRIVERTLRGPIDRLIRTRRSGAVATVEQLKAAYDAALHLPQRLCWIRAALIVVVATGIAAWLAHKTPLPWRAVGVAATVALFHGLGAQALRGTAVAQLLEPVFDGLFRDRSPLSSFADRLWGRLVRAGLATATAAVVVIAAVTHLSLPVSRLVLERLELAYAPTLAVLLVGWVWSARRLMEPVQRYLTAADADGSPRPAIAEPLTREAYRSAQLLPYQLALSKLATALLALGLLVVAGPLWFELDLEKALLIASEGAVISFGAAIYEVLWHRATLRQLLTHFAALHRPPPTEARPPLSLRSKMLTSFGGLILFACGLSTFWSFVQYKNMATGFIQREAELRLSATVETLRGSLHRIPSLPDEPARAHAVELELSRLAPSDDERGVLYYRAPGSSPPLRALSGSHPTVSRLPEPAALALANTEKGRLDFAGLHLCGAFVRLRDRGDRDLGTLALLLPGYRRQLGYNVDPQIVILVGFFVVLALASFGMVVLVVRDLTGPVRLLERRAHAMAEGDLSRPVLYASGEADEVGRLTYAFEEMRRALSDKLRSSTEINLSLEAEVSRRTSELERRNQELHGALEALQRTQAELLRSEKMASMGRLVAGIAHEINNPVNAVVNTVAPLSGTLDELLAQVTPLGEREAGLGESAADLKAMLRVIERGARRTKEIVQALHNYSRGDDDRLLEVDLHRGLDESLDLLRHHLKHGITVERGYGEIGRLRGYAGQLNQVFMNLLTNAAQAIAETGRPGTIRIATERRDGWITVTIIDDGPGIPSELLPRIFDPFFTTKDVGQGSGLGLSIVHGIVERHGGSIAVDSHLGQGTIFTVRLPVDQAGR